MTSTPPIDEATLRSWIGRTETQEDWVTESTVAGLAATLDRDDVRLAPGELVPPMWHWAFFLARTPQSGLGRDGHAKLGGFLPPVPLPRRMWAGGRLEFHHPLRIGDEITRHSRIADVRIKHGRSGTLAFVTVRHEVRNALGLALTEEHDIVYREEPRADAPVPVPEAAPTDADFSRECVADPVLLFRYSALTFNGHRIHYDRSYCRDVEGYPGLIVHGPLIATLLVGLQQAHAHGARLRRFSFRSLRPVFDIHRFTLAGRREPDHAVALWAADHEGWLAMQARAELG